MPPPMQRFGGGPNSLASHYQQYPSQTQSHLPTPSMAGSNPSFMNPNSMSNPFAVNGNGLSLAGAFGASGLGMATGTGLSSQAAQLSFAAANMHQHGPNGMGEPGQTRGGSKNRIRDVWAGNLSEEMALLRAVAERYPYVSMVSWILNYEGPMVSNSNIGYGVSRTCGTAYG
jgi:CCR4-NOT transcription complex subunit 7/8